MIYAPRRTPSDDSKPSKHAHPIEPPGRLPPHRLGHSEWSRGPGRGGTSSNRRPNTATTHAAWPPAVPTALRNHQFWLSSFQAGRFSPTRLQTGALDYQRKPRPPVPFQALGLRLAGRGRYCFPLRPESRTILAPGGRGPRRFRGRPGPEVRVPVGRTASVARVGSPGFRRPLHRVAQRGRRVQTRGAVVSGVTGGTAGTRCWATASLPVLSRGSTSRAKYSHSCSWG